MYKLIFDHILGHYEFEFMTVDSAIDSGKRRGVEEFYIEGPNNFYEHWEQNYCGDWSKNSL